MRQTARHSLLIALTAGAASAIVFAQQSGPVFRARIEHVAVDVVVTDKDDQPVMDLTKENFAIRENGRMQAIVDFERVSVPLGERLVDLRARPTPMTDVVSNARPPQSSRAVVFVLDDLTLAGQDIVPVKKILYQFLGRLGPEDRVAITFVRRSDLGQDFTTDISRLSGAVSNLNAAIMPNGMGRLSDLRTALENVIESLASAPQARRFIVLISDGYQQGFYQQKASQSNASTSADASTARLLVQRELRLIFDRAARQHVCLYTIDPRGAATPETVYGIGAISSSQDRAAKAESIRAEQEFLTTLALGAGGRGFINQSNLQWAVDQIAVENGSYFVLGYYPSPYEPDGKFHPISVTTDRPGLRVRARPGYVAQKTGGDAEPATRLRQTLTDGVPGGDLMLRAFAASLVPAATGTSTLVTVEVSYPESDKPRSVDSLELAWVALDPDARIRASGRRTVQVPLSDTDRKAFILALDDTLDLPTGRLTLRFAAASSMVAAQGRVDLPLDVPKLAETTMTALVIGVDANESVRVMHLGASATVAPFQPTTLRSFTSADRIRVFGRVISAAPPSAVTLAIRGTDGRVGRIPVRVAPSGTVKNAFDCEAVVSMSDVPPGDYALELTAGMSSGTSLQRAVAIAVK